MPRSWDQREYNWVNPPILILILAYYKENVLCVIKPSMLEQKSLNTNLNKRLLIY